MDRTKKVVDKELLVRLDERCKNMDEKLDNIYHEVKKTNGRVTSLETGRVAELEKWRARLQGSWKTLVIMAAIIGAGLSWFINSIV